MMSDQLCIWSDIMEDYNIWYFAKKTLRFTREYSRMIHKHLQMVHEHS